MGGARLLNGAVLIYFQCPYLQINILRNGPYYVAFTRTREVVNHVPLTEETGSIQGSNNHLMGLHL